MPKLSEQSQTISKSLMISITFSEFILLLNVVTSILGLNLLILSWAELIFKFPTVFVS